MRADALQVDELVRKLKDAKIQLEAGQDRARRRSCCAPRIATVSVTDNSGTQTAEIRARPRRTTYAKSSVVRRNL